MVLSEGSQIHCVGDHATPFGLTAIKHLSGCSSLSWGQRMHQAFPREHSAVGSQGNEKICINEDTSSRSEDQHKSLHQEHALLVVVISYHGLEDRLRPCSGL